MKANLSPKHVFINWFFISRLRGVLDAVWSNHWSTLIFVKLLVNCLH